MVGEWDLKEEGRVGRGGTEDRRPRDRGGTTGGTGRRAEEKGGAGVPSRSVAPRSVQGRQAKKGGHGIGKTKNNPQRKP